MSDEKKLPTKSDGERAVQLQNNGLKAGSLIEQSLSKLNPEQAQNLMGKAAEEALRLEVKTREQNLDYVAGKKVAEDHIDTFNMLEKSGKLTRQTVKSDIKTGAGNMRIESKSGAACFVATAAYGDRFHPDVVFLRAYRDSVLSKSEAGRLFIDWYWVVGPKLAKVVSYSSVFQRTAKLCVSCVVAVLKKGHKS